MLDIIKSNPWTFGIGITILILALIGVIVGIVLKGRWLDRGFMQRDGKTLHWED